MGGTFGESVSSAVLEHLGFKYQTSTSPRSDRKSSFTSVTPLMNYNVYDVFGGLSQEACCHYTYKINSQMQV